MNQVRLMSVGVAMIFVGFLVVALGASAGPGESSSSGGFILIGPIPIVFGNGPDSGTLAAVALVITVAMVALYLLSFLLLKSERRREVGVGTESGSGESAFCLLSKLSSLSAVQ
jgi:uncharacterized membrane protein